MGDPKQPDIDPELADDLGAELELRGDQLTAELEEARKEALQNLELAQRIQAEFENYRKRVARDRDEMVKRASEKVVLGLLPVVDNLERAIDHAAAGGDAELLAGVKMVLDQLLDVLSNEGVIQIDPCGQPFDAMRHQAVGQKENLEIPEGTVAEVCQKGYEMHGRTLRPAMVIVSTGGPTHEE